MYLSGRTTRSRLLPAPRQARLLLILLLIGLLPAMKVSAGEWREWRGGKCGGRSLSDDSPLHWSSSRNIRWQAIIPGEGHSSPVVTRDTVYLTTARDIKHRVPIRDISAVLLIVFGIVFMAELLFPLARSPLSLAELTRYLLLIAAFITLLLFGERLLDFNRATERGWLGAALFGLVTLRLAGLLSGYGKRASILTGIALVLYAGVLMLVSPDRRQLFFEPGNLRSLFFITVLLLTLQTGLLCIGHDLAASSPAAGRMLHIIEQRRQSFLGMPVIALATAVIFIFIHFIHPFTQEAAQRHPGKDQREGRVNHRGGKVGKPDQQGGHVLLPAGQPILDRQAGGDLQRLVEILAGGQLIDQAPHRARVFPLQPGNHRAALQIGGVAVLSGGEGVFQLGEGQHAVAVNYA